TKSGLVKARWELAPGHQLTGTLIDYRSDFIDDIDGVDRDTTLKNQQYTLGYTFARPDAPLMDFSAKVYKNRTNLEQTRLIGEPWEPTGAPRSFDVKT